MANNANYLSQPQHRVVNISCPFRHTSFFPAPPFALIFYPPEEMFWTCNVHQRTVLMVFLDVITEKPKDYTTACDARLEIAWSNNGKCQQGAILIICNVPHKRNQPLLLQHKYYLKQECYSSCYRNLCVINFLCLEKEINNPVNCYSK